MFASSLDVESAFYAAFERGDLDAMMRVWAYSFDIVCVHPSGPRLEGVDAVRRSWQHILSDPVPRSFDLRARLVVGSDDVRVHTLEEHICVPGSQLYAPPLLATNVYQRLDDGWRMIVHHASLMPAPGSAPPTANGALH
ncbi:MAG: nuclear transport factor 2 family protein [Gammaproteobacteria bacterium]|nr:nuclear transport factor 2 family protein [Gammaproteobacteria bacterium]